NAALIVTEPTCVLAPSNLVSWWPGNGDAQDIVGGQNGTFSGGQFGLGEVSQAFDFTGGSSNVRVPSSAILDIGQAIGLTVEAWINPSDPTSGQPIVEWAPNGSYGVHFWINASSPGALYADIASTDGTSYIIQTPGGTIATNRYQHVALTYDKSTGVAR